MQYYPRRIDGVIVLQFKENADEIADGLQIPVTVTHRVGKGATAHLPGGFDVNLGDYIVCTPDRKVVEVLDQWDFAAKYSKDGL